jgi:hypothetical protein
VFAISPLMSALSTPSHKHKYKWRRKKEELKVIESEQNLIPKDMDNDSTQLSKKRLMLSQKGR